MINKNFKIIFLSLVFLLLLVTKIDAQKEIAERHTKVAMRMIGHEILLQSGDSTSRVLPIEKEKGRYKIQFESEFQFKSSVLVATIDRVVKQTKIASSYLVEVEECETNQIIYSYEIGATADLDIIPCGTRLQPKTYYQIFITIIANKESSLLANGSFFGMKSNNYLTTVLQIISLLFLAALFVYLLKKKPKAIVDPNLISIGKYQLDKKNMELSFEHKKIELTSKEADLLSMLHSFANNTLERQLILKKVWGDEGDYVGRTLDVFISKLRKKLGADANVKIVNVRGVGYKLVIN